MRRTILIAQFATEKDIKQIQILRKLIYQLSKLVQTVTKCFRVGFFTDFLLVERIEVSSGEFRRAFEFRVHSLFPNA